MWTRISMLVALVCAVWAGAAPARAVEASLAELLLGKIAPLTVTLRDMDATWRRFTLGPSTPGVIDGLLTSASSAVSLTLPATEYYTCGETVTSGAVTYLIAYKRPQQTFDVVRAITARDIPAPELVTDDTPCTLCLLDISRVSALQTITPVFPQQEMSRSAAGGGVPSLRTRESELRAALRHLRDAVARFRADTGYYPASLSDIVRRLGKDAAGVDKFGDPLTGEPAAIVRKEYRGPYFTPTGGINNSGLPVNPFVEVAPTDPSYRKVATHWLFWPNTGFVTVPTAFADRATLDGIPYGDL